MSDSRTKTLLWIFWGYFPLIICNAILCPHNNLIYVYVRGISTKLHTFVNAHSDDLSCTRTITLACIFSNYFPCNITKCNFVIFLKLQIRGDICFFVEKQF